MVKIFPFIFILLWSSAFITTKPIIDNSDPFAALSFRFALVALGFFLFSIYSKQKILVSKRNFFESFFSGVLFHGFYLGGVFYSISIGMPTAIAALIVTLQPVLTNALSGPILNEKVSPKQWVGVLLGFVGATLVLGFDIGSKIPTAGLAATIIALVAITFTIHPYMGLPYTIRSFMIVIIAGLGNLPGVAISGMGLGVFEEFADYILGTEFRIGSVFLLLVLILVYRRFKLSRKREYLK